MLSLTWAASTSSSTLRRNPLQATARRSRAPSWMPCGRVVAKPLLRWFSVSIDILPTVEDADLCLSNQTDRARYRTLNQQVQR
jgi:hypothetical protein